MREVAKNAIEVFNIPGDIIDISTFGEGHINDTYKVSVQNGADARRYVLQRINTNVFKDPGKLMENIQNVTSYLRAKIKENGGDPRRETLSFLQTADGKSYFTDKNGKVWRMYPLIENTISYQMADNLEVFGESARAFGRFVMLLSDYPAHTLHETIEKFHDTRDRYNNFIAALEADSQNRAKDCLEEISFVKSRREDCSVLMDMLDKGELPLRVTHNDTKLNNVLIDEDTGKAICVIDLDTVMPGLSVSDFGDAIRFGASTGAEDEQDLSKVCFSLSHYNAYKENFLSEAGEGLTEREIEMLPMGAKILTLECGMRFLTDYLNGDTYFKIQYPQHNLVRCRTQFKLVREMEGCWDKL